MKIGSSASASTLGLIKDGVAKQTCRQISNFRPSKFYVRSAERLSMEMIGVHRAVELPAVTKGLMGYLSKDDTSILEGSCGLEYSLKHVALPSTNLRAAKKPPTEFSKPESDPQWGTCQWLMLAMVIYVCCYSLYEVVQSDLEEALNTTHQKTAEPSVSGRCGKCQSTRFSLPDPVKETYHSELQGWQSDTPSECRKPNEQGTSPRLGALFPTCNSRMRDTYCSPPRSPRSPRGGFFKKLDRPSRSRKREDFDSPRI